MTTALMKQHIKSGLRVGLNAVSPLFHRKSVMDLDTARANLLEVCPIPPGTTEAKNHLLMPSVDLQIIIPAYNVEQYLEDCVSSVLSQETTYSYHIILVDDGAKDRTPEICEQYSNHPNITVIHQPNRGLSIARNQGLREIFGKYVMFLDSDDVLMDGAIQALLDTAYQHDCDLVEGSAYYLKSNRLEIMHRYPSVQRISDPYAILHGHPWGKVYRAELFEDLCYPEGYWYEDSIITFLVFPKLTNVYVIPHICYGYRINEAGIVRSSHGKPKSVETYWITELMMQRYKDLNYPVTDSYFRSILHQFHLNQHRVSDLSVEIQESVFVLSCALLEQYFPDRTTDDSHSVLLKAMRNKDFGTFKMYCTML